VPGSSGDCSPKLQARMVASGSCRLGARVRKKKRKENGGRGEGFYRGCSMREGVGFGARGRDWTKGLRRAPPGLLDGGRRRPDRWGPPIGGRERGGDTISGEDDAGPWASSGAGPEGLPRPSLYFSCFFSFSFSDFLFIS
jgi:hypothetical protein